MSALMKAFWGALFEAPRPVQWAMWVLFLPWSLMLTIGFMTTPATLDFDFPRPRKTLREWFREDTDSPGRPAMLVIGIGALAASVFLSQLFYVVFIAAFYIYWLSRAYPSLRVGLVAHRFSSVLVAGLVVVVSTHAMISTVRWRLWLGTPAGWQATRTFPRRLECQVIGRAMEWQGQGTLITTCRPTWLDPDAWADMYSPVWRELEGRGR